MFIDPVAILKAFYKFVLEVELQRILLKLGVRFFQSEIVPHLGASQTLLAESFPRIKLVYWMP
jgi:hypothetical protein